MLLSRIHRALGLVAAIILLASTVPGMRLGFSPKLSVLQLAPVDSSALQVLSTIAPSAHIVAAIEVDVDHDGDLDLVARTTDEVFTMWLNEGQGHFVKYRPATPTTMAAAAEVSAPGGRGMTPATPARMGFDACLVAGYARPPTNSSGAPTSFHPARRLHFTSSSSGRAPPRVSFL